ncbi:hypothetical protein [Reyranella sp.]|jgi:hypothetical protein|uniref:hypothetical protein n=1 Tax=Reyranella sp. TaxID=1929291 RepID=UPI002F95D1E4
MRGILSLLLLFVLSACSIPETRWEKAGADEKAANSDLLTCRQAAQQETFATSPFYGFGFGFGPPFGRFRHWSFYDSDRFYTEGRLTDFCMRNKGYQLVTIQPPQTKPPAQAPAAPAAATDK